MLVEFMFDMKSFSYYDSFVFAYFSLLKSILFLLITRILFYSAILSTYFARDFDQELYFGVSFNAGSLKFENEGFNIPVPDIVVKLNSFTELGAFFPDAIDSSLEPPILLSS